MVHTQFTWLRPGIAAFSIEFRIVREQNEGNLSDSARVAPFHFWHLLYQQKLFSTDPHFFGAIKLNPWS